MELELFGTYHTKKGQEITITDLNHNLGTVVFRVNDGHPFTTVNRDAISNISNCIESKHCEPDFSHIKLNLLEALRVCATNKPELKYMYNTEAKTWYHLTPLGQFLKYAKVPCVDEYYWVTDTIPTELLESNSWAIPNVVIGYVTLEPSDRIWRKIC